MSKVRQALMAYTVSEMVHEIIPEGWKIRLAAAHSPEHDCVMHTMRLDEETMGWSERFTTDNPSELLAIAKRYVDECMAKAADWDAMLEEGQRIHANYDKAHPDAPLIPDQEDGIPKPSKCLDTQGEDKVEECIRCHGPKRTYGGQWCFDCRMAIIRGEPQRYRMFPDTQEVADTYIRAAGVDPTDCDAMGCPYCGAARGQPHVGCVLR